MRVLLKSVVKHRHYYYLIIPAFVLVAVFNYGPMYGIQIAFRDFRFVWGFLGSPWVGFKHFESFFNSFHFSMIMRNTIVISIYSTVAGFPIPILLALMINELRETYFRKFIQTTMYAPYFISTVVIVGMIVTMFSPSMGIVNTVREWLGFERLYFIVIPEAFWHLHVWSGVWQFMGWSSIIYIAALSTVDPELHEAARMDGANRIQRIRHINIPAISHTIIILLILSIGSFLSVGFEKIYLLQNSLNIQYSEVISTFVYKRGILNTNYSFATAVGLFNNVINVVMLLIANAIASKVSETSLF